MEQKSLICICCPLGCHMEAITDNEKLVQVTGQTCNKGKIYAIKECSNPTRVLTTTVEVENGCTEMVSVKTERDIPKDKLFDCIKELKKVKLTAPVFLGDELISDIASTGVRVIATANCERLK